MAAPTIPAIPSPAQHRLDIGSAFAEEALLNLHNAPTRIELSP